MVAVVRYREFWGERKRDELLASLDSEDSGGARSYVAVQPEARTRFLLRPGIARSSYTTWIPVPELGRVPPLNGLMEKRGGALIADNRAELEVRMQAYFDRTRDFTSIARIIGGLGVDRARFVARSCREAARLTSSFDPQAIKRYWLRAFDVQWAYATERRPIWNEPRPQLLHLLADAQGFFVSRPAGVSEPEGAATAWTGSLGDNDGLRGHAYYFPVVDNLSGSTRPNLSVSLLEYVRAVGLPPDIESSRLVWQHALAVTYSPAYLAENASGIRQGWPRVPLPDDPDLLRRSAVLGARVAALLDVDTQVPGVSTGAITPALAAIAVPATRPGAGRDWRLVGWGHRTVTGVTMPGRGEIMPRSYAAGEAATVAETALLGARTCDVGMNGASYWRNVPEAVWDLHIGGYQVLKKWMSYQIPWVRTDVPSRAGRWT